MQSEFALYLEVVNPNDDLNTAAYEAEENWPSNDTESGAESCCAHDRIKASKDSLTLAQVRCYGNCLPSRPTKSS